MVIIEDSRYNSALQEDRLSHTVKYIPGTHQLFKKIDLVVTEDSRYTSAVPEDIFGHH